MSWNLYRWTWLLEGPLFVGHLPSGSLNRCRLYIPARAVWGAVTAALARSTAEGFPDYHRVGRELQESVRFTYLYPAESFADEWIAWLPEFEKGRGLSWKREDCKGEPIEDWLFRRRLLTTRPGIAIDPGSFTAAVGSLRETECVADRWRRGPGASGSCDRVAYIGYFFIRDQKLGHLETIERIFIGGDTRYGLGSMRRVDLSPDEAIFGREVPPRMDRPIIKSINVLGHTRSPLALAGSRETLRGWSNSKRTEIVSEDVLWGPGSVCDVEMHWRIDDSGIWLEDGETA